MVSVAIVGASGYTGGELTRLLLNHPEVEIEDISSRQFEETPIHKVHPHIRGTDLVFKNKKPSELDADIIFTATPHGASMKIIPDLLEIGAKVIDLSGDYRFNDIEVYEKWYGLKHTSDIKGVYGLPEIHREEIKNANLIANPGCFVTGAILSGYPLSKAAIVDRMIFDSKTGVSGAGVNPSSSTHYPNIGDNVNPYKVTSHRHTPEIQQELGLFSDVKVSFTPHLVPVIRGILTTNHSFLIEGSEDISSGELLDIYKKTYEGEPFIQILEDGEIPRLSSIRGSNYAQIGCFEIDETGRLVVISAIDNLVKGASGQAIHNMNIICGFDEKTGLNFFGMHP
ncbi:N-acetyl-gamma-glutamyl-phosphate reductase [Methanobrevibacter olleyae]|uniref:N-acetyl-gamma-glutamyl-phosphate reductase n=1 Tax=Methanobrevibacter olleyae TaxID=294671 RepID=A0A126R023_METOL|nr:N-acetyl-gamma-glutamyl-phosphate reductase [Methanobrevibacter olleyae]AMK15733.1 N-acetyl-gamma-glutamyl-phosphate reductase ArgC [Methanobrevibacter olleyae]SFL58186.1 N-acetyl-gamma-glutamyl-phosphate reductase [Methanobrevibacter olleyae]